MVRSFEYKRPVHSFEQVVLFYEERFETFVRFQKLEVFSVFGFLNLLN